jgi:hypothetical protein
MIKKKANLFIKSILILFLMNFASFARDNGQVKFDLQKLEINLTNLNTNFKSGTKNIDNHDLSIESFKFGFSEIDFKNNYNSSNNLSDVKIIGPIINVNKLKLKSKVHSKNWIALEKIKRLKKRQTIPRLGIKKIKEASILFKIDNKEYPKNLNELDVRNYLDLNEYPFDDFSWNYKIDLPNNITAKPTRINITPSGEFIIYNFQEQSFQNNPILDSLVDIEDVEWDYTFFIQKITQDFLSSIVLSISENGKNYTAKILKGHFQMENIQLSAIPESRLTDLISLKIPKIRFEVKDFFFDGSFGDFPKINSIKSNFKIRNFDLKLPGGFIEEPEVENIIQSLGIRNNSIKIRLLEIDIKMINEMTGISIIKVHTPFLKLDIHSNLIITQNGTYQPKIKFSNSEVRLNPIALGIRKYIREWEKKNNKNLKRMGSVITLNVSGDFSNIFIHGLND